MVATKSNLIYKVFLRKKIVVPFIAAHGVDNATEDKKMRKEESDLGTGYACVNQLQKGQQFLFATI